MEDKLETLEFRIDMLKDLFNELVMKPKGVALLWYDEYQAWVDQQAELERLREEELEVEEDEG